MSDERTEEATPHKLEEARRRGQSVRSQEFASACAQATVLLALTWVAHDLVVGLWQTLRWNLAHLGESPRGLDALVSLRLVLLLGISVLASLAAQWLASGSWMWTAYPLQPELNRLNPVSNAQRFLSPKFLVEVLRLALKLSLAFYVLHGFLGETVLGLARSFQPGFAVVTTFGNAVKASFFSLAGGALVLGVADLFYQRWEFAKSMRMSKHEVKQEYRSREGDPHRKGKARQLGQKLIKARSLAGVSRASVVVTNPTHLAVALEYHFGLPAPRIVAKGAENVALAIRKLAAEQGVPLVEDKPLARALYPLDVDAYIPAELFQPVAAILVAVAKAEENAR